MNLIRRGLLIGFTLTMAGCASVRGALVTPEANDMPLDLAVEHKGEAGGVFVPGSYWSLTSDNRAFRAGDVLTVVLQESTQASKKSGTSLGKNSRVQAGPGKVLGSAVGIDTDIGMKRDFSGSGSTSQQNDLRGAVAVIVQRVLPNGLLEVRGEKRLTLNHGEEMVRLSGYVRAADIDTNNQVSSQQIANARIRYSGRGALADANRPGWLTRFFNHPWMPL